MRMTADKYTYKLDDSDSAFGFILGSRLDKGAFAAKQAFHLGGFEYFIDFD